MGYLDTLATASAQADIADAAGHTLTLTPSRAAWCMVDVSVGEVGGLGALDSGGQDLTVTTTRQRLKPVEETVTVAASAELAELQFGPVYVTTTRPVTVNCKSDNANDEAVLFAATLRDLTPLRDDPASAIAAVDTVADSILAAVENETYGLEAIESGQLTAAGVASAVNAAAKQAVATVAIDGADLDAEIELRVGDSVVAATTGTLSLKTPGGAAIGSTLTDVDLSSGVATFEDVAAILPPRFDLIATVATESNGTFRIKQGFTLAEAASAYTPVVTLTKSGANTTVRITVTKDGVAQEMTAFSLNFWYPSYDPSGGVLAPSTGAVSPAATEFTFTRSGIDLTAEAVVSVFGTVTIAGVARPVAATVNNVTVEAAEATPLTAETVDARYRWTFPRTSSSVLAAPIVTVGVGFGADVEFDLSGVIEPDNTVQSVTSVVVSDSGATTSGVRINRARKGVLATLSSVTTAGTYTATCTFVTADSQTIVVRGTLRVE